MSKPALGLGTASKIFGPPLLALPLKSGVDLKGGEGRVCGGYRRGERGRIKITGARATDDATQIAAGPRFSLLSQKLLRQAHEKLDLGR